MALLFCDGFENQGTTGPQSKWDSWTYGTSLTTAKARTGSRSCGFDTLTKFITNASGSTIIIGAAFYQIGQQCWLGVQKGGAYWPYGQCAVLIGANGQVSARFNTWQGALLGTASAIGVVRQNQWNYIEVKIVLSQTVGSFTVKVNGEQVLSVTGVDNCYLAETTFDAVELGTGGTNVWTDDFYVCDASGSQNNDFLGEIRVVSILPVTDAVDAGANADFTCSGGTDHGALVDEATPDGDTTYVSSSTVGHYDSWNFGALGYTGTIKGLQLNIIAKKTEASARAIIGVTRPTSTNRDHSLTRYLGMTDYISFPAVWELNPDDSAAWEVADVDGAEFGVKVTV